ncbi:MAG TPA: amidohydrolase family protein [Planctomycetota bacterium]|nr:amidohydrolase family protein [Planctomycetota bacterium]
MIIDSHQHTNWHGKNCHAVVADMDRAGIDVSWLLTWEVPEHEWDQAYYNAFDPMRVGMPFEDVARACELYPKRFVPAYAPDPRRPDAIERLEAAVKMYGVRVYGELKLRILFDDPDVVQMFRVCGKLGLPVVFHIDIPLKERPKPPARDYWYCVDIDRLETVLKLCPETIFIGHAPGFWRHISGTGYTDESAYPKGEATPGGRVPELLSKYKNLYADLSAGSGLNALTRGPEGRGRKFLIDFQEKLLYGRDCFDDRLMDFIRSAQLPQDAFEKITSKNALKLVPL